MPTCNVTTMQVLNILPGVLPALVVRPHFATFLAFTALRQWQTVQSHAGYNLPWDPLNCFVFKDGAARHDFHHSGNTGCYGAYSFVSASVTYVMAAVEWHKCRRVLAVCYSLLAFVTDFATRLTLCGQNDGLYFILFCRCAFVVMYVCHGKATGRLSGTGCVGLTWTSTPTSAA